MILPSGEMISTYTPIYPGSNFTWGEATKKCTRYLQPLIIDGERVISAIEVEKKIVSTARELDRVRGLLGNRPLHVTSWYRPKHINASVGGSRWSRHQYGDAVDIRSNYHHAFAMYKLLDKLHVRGGLGRYAHFVHIDYRGQIARWHG